MNHLTTLLVLCLLVVTGCSSSRANVPAKPMHPDASPHENMWLKVESTSDGWLANGKSCDNQALSKELRAWSKYSNSEYNIKGYDENDISQNSVVFQMPAHSPSGAFLTFISMLVEARIFKIVTYLDLGDKTLRGLEIVLPLDEGGGPTTLGPVAIGARVSSVDDQTNFELNFSQEGWRVANNCSFSTVKKFDVKGYNNVRQTIARGLRTCFSNIDEEIETVLLGIHRDTDGKYPSWFYLFAAIDAVDSTNPDIETVPWRLYRSFAFFDISGQGMLEGPSKNYDPIQPPEPDEPPCDDIEHPSWEPEDDELDDMKPPPEAPFE